MQKRYFPEFLANQADRGGRGTTEPDGGEDAQTSWRGVLR